MFFVSAGIVGSAIMAIACFLGVVRGAERPWNTFRAIWLSADIITVFLIGFMANALAFLGPKPPFTRGPGIFIASILATASFPLIWYVSDDLLIAAFLISPGLLGMSLIGMGISYFAHSIKRKANPEAGTAGFFYSLSGIIVFVTYFSAMFQYGAYLSLGWTYLLPGAVFCCIFYIRVLSKESGKTRRPPKKRAR